MSSIAAVPLGDRETLVPQRFATPSTAGFIIYWVRRDFGSVFMGFASYVCLIYGS